MPRKLSTIKHEKILRGGQKQDVFNQNPAQASRHLATMGKLLIGDPLPLR